jgi:(p)ppGpp synthase/HD superfamily hydrolase
MLLKFKEQLMAAIKLAVDKHYDQYDKIDMPYILHPLTVSLSFNRIDYMIVAVLHDILEDTDCTVKELEEIGISFEICKAISAITKLTNETNEEYWHKVRRNPIARVVKRMDIQHNLSRMKHLPNDEQERLIEKYNRAMEVLND